MALIQLIHDEKKKLSAARVGLWITLAVGVATIAVDVWLVISGRLPRIPNTAYALEGTMFTVFASWAAGPRIAQYLGPQVGAVASGLASAVRDLRQPSKTDDERGPQQ